MKKTRFVVIKRVQTWYTAFLYLFAMSIVSFPLPMWAVNFAQRLKMVITPNNSGGGTEYPGNNVRE
jgi:hypothetical protein